MQRWLAVLVASKKRLPVHEKLIDLLKDPHPAVRKAARDALVRIGRSTDFGPLSNATAKQIADSQRSWREWHALQVETRLAESSAQKKE
jgi:hypothetical protein